jgi:hypothetical protein
MKKSKGMMAGGKMKSKGYAGGGKMKSKGYAGGGKMPMAEKDGEMVPAFLAQAGGKMPNNMPNKMRMSSKMYAAGGVTKIKKMEGGGVARGSGAARSQKFGKNG